MENQVSNMASTRVLIDDYPYHPAFARKKFMEECFVADRGMYGRTAKTEIHYNAFLKFVFFCNGSPYYALVFWKDWESASPKNQCQVVWWSDIEFGVDLGRGKRKRVPTDRYKPEDTRERKKVKGNFGCEIREIIDLLDGDDEEVDAKIGVAVKRVEERVMEVFKAERFD